MTYRASWDGETTQRRWWQPPGGDAVAGATAALWVSTQLMFPEGLGDLWFEKIIADTLERFQPSSNTWVLVA